MKKSSFNSVAKNNKKGFTTFFLRPLPSAANESKKKTKESKFQVPKAPKLKLSSGPEPSSLNLYSFRSISLEDTKVSPRLSPVSSYSPFLGISLNPSPPPLAKESLNAIKFK